MLLHRFFTVQSLGFDCYVALVSSDGQELSTERFFCCLSG